MFLTFAVFAMGCSDWYSASAENKRCHPMIAKRSMSGTELQDKKSTWKTCHVRKKRTVEASDSPISATTCPYFCGNDAENDSHEDVRFSSLCVFPSTLCVFP
uniref:Putative secreted protein n=1 Tax=Amblyomma americanum TaxID=6943 RepID=A0A0C9SCV3_AMBAM